MGRLRTALSKNGLMHTLINLKGNARACIYTEPLWGIPSNLYLPLVARYMAALGLNELQIGLVLTVGLTSQMVSSLVSGAITDKLGRRLTTLLFDLLGWAVPLFIWMGAQGFAWFIVGALFNGMFRVPENSWGLLLAEDTPKEQLVNIYALSSVAGLIAGFVAPLTSVLVSRFTLIPTMRGLYLFAGLCMVLKALLLYKYTKETKPGQKRREELKGRPFSHAFLGSGQVIKGLFRNQPLLLVLGMMSCVMVTRGSLDNFWPLLLTNRLGIDEGMLPILAALKSVMMLLCFFFLAPRLSVARFKQPLSLGLMVMLCLQVLFFVLPRELGFLVYPAVMLEALSLSMFIPLFSSLQMLLLDQKERARMFGASIALCLLVTAPFGTINGLLARLDAALPMLLSALLCGLALWFANRLSRVLPEDLLKPREE